MNPIIYNTSIHRCTADGIITPNGTFVNISFNWECDETVDSISIGWKLYDDGEFQYDYPSGEGISGTVNWRGGSFSSESSYILSIMIGGVPVYTTIIPSMPIGFDRKVDYSGAALNKTAELDGVFDINFQTRFFGGLRYMIIPYGTDLDDLLIPNVWASGPVLESAYRNCPLSSGTFSLDIRSLGDEGQLEQIITQCSKMAPKQFKRYHYQGSWGPWMSCSHAEITLYEDTDGSSAAITLAHSASHYRYLEIFYVDNNGLEGGYSKVYNANGKTVHLQLQEAAASIFLRQTAYTISGTTITPKVDTASYVKIASSGTVSTSVGTNYIKIIRVIGHP